MQPGKPLSQNQNEYTRTTHVRRTVNPKEAFAALFAVSALAMIAMDPSGRVVGLSRVAESSLGYTIRDVYGQPGAMLLPVFNRRAVGSIEPGYRTIAIRADGTTSRVYLMTGRVADNWIVILRPSAALAMRTH